MFGICCLVVNSLISMNTFSFVAWNCRGGISTRTKQHLIRSMIKKEDLLIMGLVETKCHVTPFMAKSLWPNLDFGSFSIPSLGASGGLVVLWNSVKLSPTQVFCGEGWIAMDFDWHGTACRFILLYASNCPQQRSSLWQELLPISSFSGLLFISGDFNEITRPSERLNCSQYSPSMQAFNAFISQASLLDLPLTGRSFTWSNSLSSSRIDRCLISSSVISLWPACSLIALPKSSSDHCPIHFISQKAFDWGPKPFRSINAWWSREEFYGVVEESWCKIQNQFPNASLCQRLRELRGFLKEWNWKCFGNISSNLTEIQKNITGLEIIKEARVLDNEESSKLDLLRLEEQRVLDNAESLWRQKSRLRWTIMGDRNTKYFHAISNLHYRQNFLGHLCVDGVELSTPSEIKTAVSDFFSSLYEELPTAPFSLEAFDVQVLSADVSDSLIAPFLIEEVYAALLSCNQFKAPGPDGFNFFFYRKAWDVLKDDFMSLFHAFSNSSSIPSDLNHSFLVLIPKVQGSSELKDFRPISLINGLVKLISKVLSRRLAPFLPLIISETQFSFMKGRCIQDCTFIAAEIVHLIHRRKQSFILLKLDFHKAFDTVSWHYLFSILTRMNFPKKWIDWVASLLKTSRISPLVNGSATAPFRMRRGVRQGDPLSPMLFDIAVEGLKCILAKARQIGITQGVPLESDEDQLSLLQFADDTLIFVPNNIDMFNGLIRVLRCFEAVSGLSINFSKSAISGINVPQSSLDDLASRIGCTVSAIPFTYLGLPLVNRAIPASLWEPIIAKVQRRLNSWQGSFLSPSGRAVLINSVLHSIPIYYFSLYAAPKCVLSRLKGFCSGFLWSGNIDKRGIAKLSWEKVCKPKKFGGLGCSNLWLLNRGLLLKWIWKVRYSARPSLWSRVSFLSSGITHCFHPNLMNQRHLSPIWKGIFKACIRNNQIWDTFVGHCSMKIGSGEGVFFWHDVWIGSECLSKRFPNLYGLSRQKDSKVVDVYPFNSSFRWNRSLRITEAAHFQELLLLLQQVSLSSEVDVPFWHGRRGSYSSQNFALVWYKRFTPHPHSHAFKLSWSSLSLPRVKFSTWLAIHGCLPNNSFLSTRGVPLLFGKVCTLCFQGDESVDHCLLFCSNAYAIWNWIFRRIGIPWAMPFSLPNFIAMWHGQFYSHKYSTLWSLMGFHFLWHIWKHRNYRVFNHSPPIVDKVIHKCIMEVVSIYKARVKDFSFTGNDLFYHLETIFGVDVV